MHYSNTIFQSIFFPYIKGMYPWNEVGKQFYFPNRLIFLLQTDLEEIFQL